MTEWETPSSHSGTLKLKQQLETEAILEELRREKKSEVDSTQGKAQSRISHLQLFA